MAGKKRRSSRPAGKRTATSGSRRSKPVYSPITREVGALICLALCLVVIVSMFGGSAPLLRWVRALLRGLVGYGFYLIPFCLLLSAVTLFFHRGQPVQMRVASTMLLPVSIGGIIHLFTPGAALDWSWSIVKELYLMGVEGTSGGLVAGLVGQLLQTILGRLLSVFLLVLLTLLLLIMAFNMTIASLIRAIKNRPRPEPEDEEEEEEPVDTATALVNHVAQKHIERVNRSRRFAYDIPLDDPEPPKKAEKQLRAKSPDELIQERRAAANAELEARLHQVQQEVSPMPENTVEEPQILQEPEPVVEQIELIPPVKPEPVPEKVKPEETRAAAEEIARNIENQPVSTESYDYPPITLLDQPTGSAVDGYVEMRDNQQRLANTLQSFNIDAEIQNVTRGPSVTRYELKLDQGVKLSKITNLSDDIALSLGASGVRISAIPDQISVVGIEVPNKLVSTVYAREVIDSNAFKNHKSKVAFALGKDIGGNEVVGNIAKLPHLLIAGTTGSGKSVCMNTLIISLLYKAKPEEVKLIMVDPKMVELGIYNGIPHLLIPVVTDPKKAAGALQWAVTEMMRRYRLMADAGVRDLESYNRQAASVPDMDTMPQLVVVIDELADLMLVAAKEVEESICRVAQMGRASGIHLVIATQRPSADVITGLMKANIPSRIAFAVASAMESRIILDTPGAEKLVGKGDMLYAPLGQGKPLRVQGCFISDDEVQRVVSFIKNHAGAEYNDAVMEQIDRHAADAGKPAKTGGEDSGSASGFDDDLLPAAVEVILETGQASVSMLQRRLKLGYARAARIVDEMEEKGIVGPFEGSKPRQLLITREQWQQMQNPTGGESVPDETVSDESCPF
jgi:S-DNA-T family DNA segregation ATPase FtsK/SpoIIIE